MAPTSLPESRELRALLDAIGEAVIVVDGNGRATHSNTAANLLLGNGGADRRRDDALTADGEVRPGNDNRPLKRALRGERVKEDFVVHAARGDISVAMTASPMLDDAGRIVGALGVFRDVTERKHSEDALQGLVHHASDGILVADVEGRYTFANPAACRMLGYAREELLGKTILDFIPTEDVPRLWTDNALLVPGDIQLSEWRLTCKDGSLLPVEISSGILPDGRWQAFIRDVSARKRAEEELRQLEERFRLTIDNAPIGMALIGVDGGWLRVNHALAEIVGYSIEELLARNYRDITHPEDLHTDRHLVRQLLDGEIPNYEISKRYIRKDGELAETRVQVSVVRDASGAPKHFIIQVEDITETKRLERELRRTEQIYRAIVQHLPGGAAFMVDQDLRYLSAEGSALGGILSAYGIESRDLVGRHVPDVIPESRRDGVVALYRDTLGGHRQHREIVLGDRRYDLDAVPLLDGSDKVSSALIFCHDVTERHAEAEELRRTRDLLARERSLFEATLANIQDGVVLLDADRRIVLANKAFAEMFELDPTHVPGLTRAAFVAQVANLVEDPLHFYERLQQTEHRKSDEFAFIRPTRRILRRSWKALELAEGTGYLVVWHDVTAEKQIIAERERQLVTDVLTGILNRRAADEALTREFSKMRRLGSPLSVALFDVDHFKQVNDVHGHTTGDDVLRQVAKTIAAEARGSDTVARWGGEEFIAILPVAIDGAHAFCERARRAVEALQVGPVERVTASAGVVQLGRDESAAAAVARADERLYEAKRAGRNRVRA